jgi:hypothetical protein
MGRLSMSHIPHPAAKADSMHGSQQRGFGFIIRVRQHAWIFGAFAFRICDRAFLIRVRQHVVVLLFAPRSSVFSSIVHCWSRRAAHTRTGSNANLFVFNRYPLAHLSSFAKV